MGIRSLLDLCTERTADLLLIGITIPKIDLGVVLEQLIHPDSREKLKHLQLYETEVCSSIRRMGQISEMFPGIKIIEITKLELGQRAFENLCFSFTGLTHLTLDENCIKSLNGIGYLQNLEFLSMMGAQLETDESIREIFKLKKLCVLDMSGFSERGCPNLSSYLACNDSLPELTCLDISFNNITELQLQLLLANHPKLNMISLIGTPLENLAPIDNRQIEMLTVFDLESCLTAFKHYKKPNRFNKRKIILIAMRAVIRQKYKEHKASILHECFNAVIPEVETVEHWEHIQGEAVDVLYELCTENRIRMFNYGEIQRLIDFFLNVCDDGWEQEKASDEIYFMQAGIWAILNTPTVINNSTANWDFLCFKAGTIIKRSSVLIEDGAYPLEDAMFLIHKCWQRRHCVQYGLGGLFYDIELHNHLVLLMEQLDFQHIAFHDLYSSFLFVSSGLIFDNIENMDENEIQRIAIYIWASNLRQFEGNERMQTKIFRKLSYAIHRSMMNMEVFLELPWFQIFSKLLMSDVPYQRKHTVDLFVLIHSITQCSNLAQLTKMMIAKQGTSTIIINEMKMYTPGVDDYLGVYKFLEANGSRCSKYWAQWVLSHFRDVEEPRSKRMKIIRN
ncbi:hypothetical protein CAEBREN_28354 [Caenorhabditis brenneri]|uniref:Uncharacterized protein n=1 Tax=Caenorhabditis brenneri TaxID=135651 RepID=G0MBA6_CAEBE|nr:hypothetical protein CAEBREN_28354 [Caenorhabditis brenneri]